MIRTLIREQLRTQCSYIVWAGTLIAAAVGLVAFAMGTGGTAQAHARYDNELWGWNYDHVEWVSVPSSMTAALSADDARPTTSWAALDDALTQAEAAGVDASVAIVASVRFEPPNDTANRDDEVTHCTSVLVHGAFRWDTVLHDGTPPRSGEVVLAPWLADLLSADTGDSVPYFDGSKPAGAFTVSGIAYSNGDTADAHWTPCAYLLADDASLPAIEDPLAFGQESRLAREPVVLNGTVAWNGSFPALDLLDPAQTAGRAGTGIESPSKAPWVLALVMSAGVVVTAFAAGRARAAERVRWSATARALGASRRSVALASLADGAVVTVAAGAVGTAAGAAVAAAVHSATWSSVPYAAPVDFSFPAYAIAACSGAALALGGIVSAVPAFLATRVSPAAALQDSPAIDEAEVSRRVRIWPLTLVALALYLVVLWSSGEVDNSGPVSTIGEVATLTLWVVGFALVVEASRGLARLTGRLMSRSHRPWVLHASIELHAHPRQAAALITLHGLVAASLVAWAAVNASAGGHSGDFCTFSDTDRDVGRLVDASVTLLPWRIAFAVLIAAAAVGAASFAATRGLGAADENVASALGLDRGALLKGSALRLALPGFAGAVLGSITSAVLASYPLLVKGTTYFTETTPEQTRGLVASLAIVTLAIVGASTVLAGLMAFAVIAVRARSGRPF